VAIHKANTCNGGRFNRSRVDYRRVDSLSRRAVKLDHHLIKNY